MSLSNDELKNQIKLLKPQKLNTKQKISVKGKLKRRKEKFKDEGKEVSKLIQKHKKASIYNKPLLQQEIMTKQMKRFSTKKDIDNLKNKLSDKVTVKMHNITIHVNSGYFKRLKNPDVYIRKRWEKQSAKQVESLLIKGKDRQAYGLIKLLEKNDASFVDVDKLRDMYEAISGDDYIEPEDTGETYTIIMATDIQTNRIEMLMV